MALPSISLGGEKMAKCVSLFVKLKRYRLVFDDPTVKKRSVDTLLEFFQDSRCDKLDVSDTIVYLRWNDDGKERTTEKVIRVSKISKWTVWDEICYVVWFPWGIRQRCRVDTADGKHYLVRFSDQTFAGFSLYEKALFEGEG